MSARTDERDDRERDDCTMTDERDADEREDR